MFSIVRYASRKNIVHAHGNPTSIREPNLSSKDFFKGTALLRHSNKVKNCKYISLVLKFSLFEMYNK